MPMEFVFDVPYVVLSGAHFGTGLVSTARGRVALNVNLVVQKTKMSIFPLFSTFFFLFKIF